MTRIQGRHLDLGAPLLPGWELRVRHFSCSEGPGYGCGGTLGPAFASWGAVSTWLEAQRAAFFRLKWAPVGLRNSEAGIHILRRRFQAHSSWLGS